MIKGEDVTGWWTGFGDCIIWPLRGVYHVPLAFQCIYRCSDERDQNGDGEEGREWRLPGLLHADDLVLCDFLLRCVGEEV